MFKGTDDLNIIAGQTGRASFPLAMTSNSLLVATLASASQCEKLRFLALSMHHPARVEWSEAKLSDQINPCVLPVPRLDLTMSQNRRTQTWATVSISFSCNQSEGNTHTLISQGHQSKAHGHAETELRVEHGLLPRIGRAICASAAE